MLSLTFVEIGGRNAKGLPSLGYVWNSPPVYQTVGLLALTLINCFNEIALALVDIAFGFSGMQVLPSPLHVLPPAPAIDEESLCLCFGAEFSEVVVSRR